MSGTATPGAGENPGVTPGQAPPVVTPPGDAGKIVFNSQAELDNSLAERLSRKELATRKAIAEKLGTTPEELDNRLAHLSKVEKDSLTDAERKVVEAKEEATRVTEERVRGEMSTKLASAQTAIIRAEVIQQAQAAGFRHPEDVWEKAKDDKGLTIDADSFAVKGADKVIEKIAKERPDWIGSTSRVFGGSPPGGGGGPTTKRVEMAALEQTMLERRGRLSGGNRNRL